MHKVDAIVSVKWLADKISITVKSSQVKTASSPKDFRVLDGSWHLPNAKRNASAEYDREHIPGAMFFDIDACADPEATKLNHMLPKPADFESYVSKLGINNNTHVIVYDNSDKFPLFSAQRVWWTFRAFGHHNISVLEGGLPKWRKLKQELSDVKVQVPVEKFTAVFNPNYVKSFEQIEANQFKEKTFTLVDARPPGRFTGQAPEPRAGTAHCVCHTRHINIIIRIIFAFCC